MEGFLLLDFFTGMSILWLHLQGWTLLLWLALRASRPRFEVGGVLGLLETSLIFLLDLCLFNVAVLSLEASASCQEAAMGAH